MDAKKGKEPETYHPKLRQGKPYVIIRDGERIIVERKPRDGREAVLVTIETLDNPLPDSVG